MGAKSENWKGRGRVSVSRDARGRFVHWERIISVFRGKAVSVYGTAKTKYGSYSARYDLEYGTPQTGTVRELRDAVARALHLPPKRRFTTVGAREFLSHPYDYGTEGHWVGRPDIDS
jgi:hypothetical protein